jgi:O-antigen ligase
VQAKRTIEMLSHFPETEYGQIFHAAVKMWWQHPFLGIGRGQFQSECAALAARGEVMHSAEYIEQGCNMHAHNVYLQWLSETGTIGLMLWCAFIMVCVREWWRARVLVHPAASVACAAALSGLFFPFVNSQNIFVNWPAALFWLSLACTMATLNVRRT